MRTATTAATFHKARYQNALIASTTAASLRTRRLAAAATSTTFLAVPTVVPPTGALSAASAIADTATTTVNKQTQGQQQQQQTTNKTWPPGSNFISGRRQVGAATATTTFISNPATIAHIHSSNNNKQSQSGNENPNQRVSGRESSLPEFASNSKNHRSLVLSADAYKRVHLSILGKHSGEPPLKVQDSRSQPVETTQVTDNEPTLLISNSSPASAHLLQQQLTHEYQELTAADEFVDHNKKCNYKSNPLDIATASGAIIRNHENHLLSAQRQRRNQHEATKVPDGKKKPKNLTMATLRPISPQYQHTLDSAISLSKELASKNMADSGESSPKTPNSPDKKRFNFKLKHFSKSYSEASASIGDIESSISDEAKLAYKSLVERGQFNSSHQPFSCDSGRSFNNYRNNSPNGLRDLYANDDFHSPTTPPATTSKFKYSTFSVKKTFF